MYIPSETSEKLILVEANIEELKATAFALQTAMKEFIEKHLSSEQAKDYDKIFAESLSKIRGVDIFTNISTGKVVITKYSRAGEAERWELKSENSDSSS